jgi:CRP/FNR family transcriptional regulator
MPIMTNRELIEETYSYQFKTELINEICENGQVKHFDAGEVIIEIGDTMQYMPLLIDGAIKVMREDDQGDDLLLYFLEKGDTCAMTLTCCIGNSSSEIRAEAEMDSVLVMVPVQKMSEWIGKYEDWKAFVLNSYNNRLTEMLESIDSLAFMNMHERIYKYLRDKVTVNKELELTVTHQEVANDLHTSRVVVSRILKSLEKEGKIAMHRNKISLLDF